MKQSQPGPGVGLALLQHLLCSVNRCCQQGKVVLARGGTSPPVCHAESSPKPESWRWIQEEHYTPSCEPTSKCLISKLQLELRGPWCLDQLSLSFHASSITEALASKGRFLTTGPPGKPHLSLLKKGKNKHPVPIIFRSKESPSNPSSNPSADFPVALISGSFLFVCPQPLLTSSAPGLLPESCP